MLALFFLAACVSGAPQEATTHAESSQAGEAAPVEATAEPTSQAPQSDIASLLPATSPPFSTQSWSTDFSRRLVEWEEIVSGGPPKDGIPAIDAPTFENVVDAGAWLTPRDPVILFAENDDVRGYPLSILIWHEIVNDTVGGKPVAVTFCPLCNASIVFDRTLDGDQLDFGTTGKLRNSDLIMYDRQTESWWQQFTGQAIVGQHAGRQLQFLPAQVVSFADLAEAFPDAQMLARPPASRSYGANPYVGYDSQPGRPFLYDGALDERLAPTERIAGVQLGDGMIAYPFASVAAAGVINDEVGGTPVAVFHKPGVASALDTQTIGEGRDVGSVAVFDRRIDDRVLTFDVVEDGVFVDAETGSTWNILGEAVDGELAGRSLTQVIAFDHFWFAWTAFFPETALYPSD